MFVFRATGMYQPRPSQTRVIPDVGRARDEAGLDRSFPLHPSLSPLWGGGCEGFARPTGRALAQGGWGGVLGLSFSRLFGRGGKEGRASCRGKGCTVVDI